MRKKIVIVISIIGAVAAVLGLTSSFPSSVLEFSAHTLPAKAGEDVTVIIDVTNQGPAVWNVRAETEFGDLLTTSRTLIVLEQGQSASITTTQIAPDVEDGVYQGKVRLKYSRGFTDEVTSPKIINYTILPNVEITDVGWTRQLELPHSLGDVSRGAWNLLLGKSSLCTTDMAVLVFKVHNKSANAYYSGLSASAKFNISHPNLSIIPTVSDLGEIGPNGSPAYSFELSSNNSPPSTNEIIISIFSELSPSTPIVQSKANFTVDYC